MTVPHKSLTRYIVEWGDLTPPFFYDLLPFTYGGMGVIPPYKIDSATDEIRRCHAQQRANELRNTVIPQGTLSYPSGNSPCVAPAEIEPPV